MRIKQLFEGQEWDMRISFVQPLGSGILMPLKEKQISADFERILTLSFKQSRRHR